ncbi:hypothetical protein EZH22_09955 [Xanthobacter dioxanivorans]|uniref:Lipoprotein n=1 Tax=Xanthobacter dioxanivorans TaxID=2528964 RepID=A0A974SK90_9HYPH|nr:hypothetical protein [Xanthobacter dioxanivorans]QRG08575.1 hypothetical protein EZH22_09955 [Xanthobacter dioxanivorans]
MKIENGVFRSLRLVLGLGLALSVAGCESTDFFSFLEQQKKPLPGARNPVFPTGVPGVDYSSRSLGQPSNPAAVEPPPTPPPSGQQQQQR